MFFTATDGNHGRGVAWTARELGCRAVVRMPKGTVKSRVENIRALGAEVTVEERNYDGCVRLAAQQAAQTPGGVLVQDTAWPGYEQIPLHIMQGYLTMALEADEQMDAPPTHVFLQAGVGSMAAAVAAYFEQAHPQDPPKIILVEPTAADCFFRSAAKGEITAVKGDMRDDDGRPCLRRAEPHRLGHTQGADGGVPFLRGRGGGAGHARAGASACGG